MRPLQRDRGWASGLDVPVVARHNMLLVDGVAASQCMLAAAHHVPLHVMDLEHGQTTNLCVVLDGDFAGLGVARIGYGKVHFMLMTLELLGGVGSSTLRTHHCSQPHVGDGAVGCYGPL